MTLLAAIKRTSVLGPASLTPRVYLRFPRICPPLHSRQRRAVPRDSGTCWGVGLPLLTLEPLAVSKVPLYRLPGM